jgi:hypothetical protein
LAVSADQVHGQTASQEHDSKYVPVSCQAIVTPSRRAHRKPPAYRTDRQRLRVLGQAPRPDLACELDLRQLNADVVCPPRRLDKGNLLPNADLAGSVQLWQWIGDEGATTFSY